MNAWQTPSVVRSFNDDDDSESDSDRTTSSDTSQLQTPTNRSQFGTHANSSANDTIAGGEEHGVLKAISPALSSLALHDEHQRRESEVADRIPESLATAIEDEDHVNAITCLHPEIRPRVVYKGRKYDWKAKVNMHIHIVEHQGADCLELIAFNSSTFSEAPHVYVKASYIFGKVVDEDMEEKLEAIVSQCDKLKFPVPEDSVILKCLLSYRASNFLIDHMIVQTKPFFAVDIKEVDSNPKLGNRRTSILPKLQDDSMSRGATSRTNVPNAMLTSITLKKAEKVVESEVKRYGKSSTLVGDVVNAKTYKDDEMLYKIIATISASALPSQATRILSRLSTLPGATNKITRRSNPFEDTVTLKAFAKFRNDNDLLQESLSFLHISDMLLMQSVCKRWKSVLSYAVKLTSSLYITTRDYYFSEDIASERNLTVQNRQKSRAGGSRSRNQFSRASTPSSTSSRPLSRLNSSRESDTVELRPPERFKVRDVYVLPDIALKVMRSCAKHLTELRLHYVVMNLEMIGYLACLSGRLKKLSLGLVKIDDQVRKYVEKKEASPPKPQRPSLSMPSTRNMLNRRRTAPVVAVPVIKEQEEVKVEVPEEPPLVVANLRLLNSADLKAILFSCGAELHTLELSVVMGMLRPDTFNYAPKLTNLIMHDTLIAPQLVSNHKEVQGSVSLAEFSQAMLNIPMADLLALISDAHDEAFLLTDRRGRIVVANDAWCSIFGYEVGEVMGNTLDFLMGSMTDEAYQLILNGLKSQLKAEECNVFLHHRNNSPLLCQVIMLPNISRYRGAPLQSDCLTYDFLGQLALEQEDNVNKVKIKGKRDWKVASKDLSYHLLRFGVLSKPFHAYHNAASKL
eukprot:gene27346-33031_t